MTQETHDAVHEFVNARSAFKAAEVFQRHRELLARPEAKDVFLSFLRDNPTKARGVAVYESRWDMLDRFLEVGPDAALEDFITTNRAVEAFVDIEPGSPVLFDAPARLLSREADWAMADLLVQARWSKDIERLLTQRKKLRALRSGQGLHLSPVEDPPALSAPPAEPTPARPPGNDQADQRREAILALAKAHLDDTRGDRAEHLQQAIDHLGALEHELRQTGLAGVEPRVTDQLFRTCLNAGTAFAEMARLPGRKITDYPAWKATRARAARATLAAKSLFATGMVAPGWLAPLCCALGNMYSTRGYRRRAVQSYLLALEAANRAGDALLAANLHHNLGDEVAKMDKELPGARLLAVEHLRRALSFFGASTHPEDRLQSLRVLARVLFDQRDWSAAETVLAEAVAITGARLPALADADARRREVEWNEDVFARSAFCLLRQARLEEAVTRLEQGKARLARERFEDPDHQVGPPPSLLDVIPEGGAAIMFFVTDAGGAALLVKSGTRLLSARDIIWFDGDIEAALRDLFADWINSYLRLAARRDPRWEDALDRSMRDLWRLIMAPIVERLTELGVEAGAELLVFPHGRLASLPLHCAYRLVGGRRRYAIDDFAFRLVPSLGLLDRARRLASGAPRAGTALLAVADPRSDLRGAALEGQRVAETFAEHGAAAPVLLSGMDASRERILAALPGKNHLLLSCHARYHWGTPSLSALLLAGDDSLTLAEVQATAGALGHLRLVFLSACESGISEVMQTPDELLGFPTAFLVAGAPAVIASLWRVNDVSTAFLARRFYDRLLGGSASMAQALRLAALDLCELPPEALDLSNLRAAGGLADAADGASRDAPAEGGSAGARAGWALRDRPCLWGAFAMYGA